MTALPASGGFEHPLALGLLLFVPVIAVFYALALRARRRALATLLGDPPPATIERGAGRTRRALEAALATLFLGLSAIALAGPRWGIDREHVKRHGSDVVIVLDVSRSMLAQDVTPSRLGRARREIRGLLDEAPGERVALVTFAGDARLECPLTLDHDTLGMFVDEADPNISHRGGSNLAAALDEAGKALEASSGAGKAVVILSDGEDFSNGTASAAVAAAERLRAKGAHVDAIGLGTRYGAKIPVTDERGHERFFTDPRGQEVITKLDSRVLEAVARAGGGDYLEAERVAFPMDELWRKRISRLAKGSTGEADLKSLVARFQWFLLPGIFVAVLWWMLPLGIPRASRRAMMPRPGEGDLSAPRPRATGESAAARELSSGAAATRAAVVGAISLGLALGLAPSRAHAAAPRSAPTATPAPPKGDAVDEGARGDALYRKGDFDGAAAAYDYAARNAGAPNGPYNLGNAKFRAKKFREASRAWGEAERRARDPEVRRDALYNEGNALLAEGSGGDSDPAATLKKAIDAYDSALRLDPTDAAARRNRAIAIARWVDAVRHPAQKPHSGDPKDSQQADSGQQKDSNEQKNQSSQGGKSGDPQKQDSQPQNGSQGQPQGSPTPTPAAGAGAGTPTAATSPTTGSGSQDGEQPQATPLSQPQTAEAEAAQRAHDGETPVNEQELERIDRMLDQRERIQRQLELQKQRMHKQEGEHQW